MLTKIFLSIVGVVGLCILGIWVFNHVNPWVGIFVFLLPLYFLFKQIDKKTKL